ncbi:MAG: AMP-binding protein, partial [Salinisphaera sp.]|nr:AMP-binding protein [Salinisphaera sp.]
MGRALGQMLVGALLENAAIRFPDAPALLCADTGRRFTFAELDARANRLAHAIEGLGIAKGDVLAFVVSNRAELIDIYFALARTGVIGIPVNYRLAASEIKSLAESMGAKALIYEDRFA